MSAGAEYYAYWRANPHHSLGPGDWRSHYHGTPASEYADLCDAAEDRGYVVELCVGAQRIGAENEKHREFKCLYIGAAGATPAVTLAIGQGEGMRSVGMRGLRKLEMGA